MSTLLLFKLVLLTGLALWMTLGIINNLAAFSSGVAAIGRLMSMEMLDMAPPITTPLQARRVTVPVWHRLVYVVIIVIQAAGAALFWYAVLGFAGLLFGTAVPDAVARANLAFAVLLGMAFVMTLGGQWFAYFIRQDILQLTHWMLIVIAVVGAIVVNLA